MPNPNFRRWTSDDISILKKMAQTHPMAQIAARWDVKNHERSVTWSLPQR